MRRLTCRLCVTCVISRAFQEGENLPGKPLQEACEAVAAVTVGCEREREQLRRTAGMANFVILEVRDFACFCGSKYVPSM